MIIGLVTTLWLGATPSPQALPGADLAIEVPRLSAASGVFAFLDRAGESSAVLQSESWSSDFDPIFHSNPTQRDSLSSAGLDPEGPAVVSARDGVHLTCLRVLDAKKFEAAANERLKGQGTYWEARSGDVALHGSREGEALGVGYVQLGRKVCLMSTGADDNGEAILREAAAVIHQGAPTQGPLVVNAQRGRWKVSGSPSQLCAEADANAMATPLKTSANTQSLPARLASGLFFAQGVATAQSLALNLEPLVRGLCNACGRAPLHALFAYLSTQITGELVWRAEGLRPSPQLSDRLGLLRALKYAGAAVLGHAQSKELQDRLAGLITAVGGTQDGKTWGLPVDGAKLSLSIEKDLLYFWSDDGALDSLRQMPVGSRSEDRGELSVTIDGPKLSSTLGSLSPLELLRRPELAPLLAVQLELSPLLALGSGKVIFGRPGHGRITGCWKFKEP